MKLLLISLFIFFACSCKQPPGEPAAVSIPVEKGGSAIKPDTSYAFYFTFIDGRKYHILCDRERKDAIQIDAAEKYGIANDSMTIVLPVRYDKIYNPDATILNCIEIRQGNLVGIFNYHTGQILEPRFDFILPADSQISDHAYGYKAGNWFRVSSTSLNDLPRVNLRPEEVFKSLFFDSEKVKGKMFFVEIDEEPDEDWTTGEGVMMLPSYVEFLNPFGSNSYEDMIIDDTKNYDSGTEELRFSPREKGTFWGKFTSLILSAYESGIGERGYVLENEQLVLYDKERGQVKSYRYSYPVGADDDYRPSATYRFVNDSIAEMKSAEFTDDEPGLYDFMDQFRYLKISREGDITPLESVRHFDFTKFVLLNEEYFKGRFASCIREEEMENDPDYNIWESEHLSLQDLEFMQNEIYAEYGLRFKEKKWADYFSLKKWYQPRFDNVDDQLTGLDKANIRLIETVRREMEGREQEYTKRRKGMHVAAG